MNIHKNKSIKGHFRDIIWTSYEYNWDSNVVPLTSWIKKLWERHQLKWCPPMNGPRQNVSYWVWLHIKNKPIKEPFRDTIWISYEYNWVLKWVPLTLWIKKLWERYKPKWHPPMNEPRLGPKIQLMWTTHKNK